MNCKYIYIGGNLWNHDKNKILKIEIPYWMKANPEVMKSIVFNDDSVMMTGQDFDAWSDPLDWGKYEQESSRLKDVFKKK